MGTKLLDHNQITLEEVENFIATKQDCCVVNPCGSGKTAVMANVIKNHPNNTFTLVTKQSNARDYYLKKDNVFKGVTIITYNKLLRDYKANAIDKYSSDFLLLDEAHYMGANKWFLPIGCIKKRFKPILIGFTATPQRFFQQGTEETIVSNYFNGNVAGNFTTEDLRTNGLFVEPECVVSYYNLDMELEKRIHKIENSDMDSDKKLYYIKKLYEIQTKWLKESQPSIILEQYLPNYMYKNQCNRILVYAPNIDMLKKDKQMLMSILKGLFRDKIIKSYDYTYKENSNNFDEFLIEDNTYIKILFSIDKIMETIHIDDLNIIIMLRPSVSNRIITQQYGRINNINNKNKSLIIDFVGNIDNLGSISFNRIVQEREKSQNKGSVNISLKLKHIGVYKDLFSKFDKQLKDFQGYTYQGLTGNLNFFAEVFSCDKKMLKNYLNQGFDIEDAIKKSDKIKHNYTGNILDNTHDITVSDKPIQMPMEQLTEIVNEFITNKNVIDEDMQQDLYLFAYSTAYSSRIDLYRALNSKYMNWCRQQVQSEELKVPFQEDYLSLQEEDIAYDDVYNNILRYDLDCAMQCLREKELTVLKYRFGLDDEIEHTLEETGHLFNVTRETIRQVEARALRKLRFPTRSERIKGWLNIDNETDITLKFFKAKHKDNSAIIEKRPKELKTIGDYLKYSTIEAFIADCDRVRQKQLDREIQITPLEIQLELQLKLKERKKKERKERERLRKLKRDIQISEFPIKCKAFMLIFYKAYLIRNESNYFNRYWKSKIKECKDMIRIGQDLLGKDSVIIQDMIKMYHEYVVVDSQKDFEGLLSCNPAPPPQL